MRPCPSSTAMVRSSCRSPGQVPKPIGRFLSVCPRADFPVQAVGGRRPRFLDAGECRLRDFALGDVGDRVTAAPATSVRARLPMPKKSGSPVARERRAVRSLSLVGAFVNKRHGFVGGIDISNHPSALRNSACQRNWRERAAGADYNLGQHGGLRLSPRQGYSPRCL